MAEKTVPASIPEREVEIDATRTLPEVLRVRAAAQPSQMAYTVLVDGDDAAVAIDYAGLDARARGIAAAIGAHGGAGKPVLLVEPPGIDFISAFYGCLYAGAIAVPAYPPQPGRLEATMARLVGVANDCRPALGLTTAEHLPFVRETAQAHEALATIEWIGTDAVSVEDAATWQPPVAGPQDIAFLQYTSGSTGEPKGVMVSHGNVLANLALIHEGVAQRPGSCAVLWLPPYHDMGLVNLLYASVVGFPCVVLPTLHFLQRPARWLAAIDRFRATYSGGPNFAYDLCARKVTDDEMAGWDLGCWEVAFNGAERVRVDSMGRFAERFRRAGFSPRAAYPCYGLAEATVAVCGGSAGRGPHIVRAATESLREGYVELPAADDTIPTTLVASCGTTKSGHRLRIVDPPSARPLDDGTIGEIWFSGPSVALGYWGRPVETREVFEARLVGDDRPYLRTGDLGFMRGDDLFVTGRLKDVIIVNGRNVAPEDVETSVDGCHPMLRPGGVAAFAGESDGTERLVVACEVRGGTDRELAAVADQVARTVGRAHDGMPADVVLVEARTIPKTPSGKVRRRECREAYEAGRLTVLLVRRGTATRVDVESASAPLATERDIVAWLVERIAVHTGIAPAHVDADGSFESFGLDSLAQVELLEELGTVLGRVLDPTLPWEQPSIRSLARYLAKPSGTQLPGRSRPHTFRPSAEALRFYQEMSADEDRRRTNVHYELPPRFFEAMTGGRWHLYSCNVWSGIADPDPDDVEQQTRAQERKLDVFAELLELRPGSLVVDVGAGNGGALIYLAGRHGVRGVGVTLSQSQCDYATAWAGRAGVDCRFAVRHWSEVELDEPVDAILTDEVIVHISRLNEFFVKAVHLLRDGGVLVNKEMHFAHPVFGRTLDRMTVLINQLYGGTGNYRVLGEELLMAHDGGMAVEEVRQLPAEDYFLTARSWYGNMRHHEDELVALVGEETYTTFLKYLTATMLGPGGKAGGPPAMAVHFVKCRKPQAALRARIRASEPPAESLSADDLDAVARIVADVEAVAPPGSDADG